MILFLESFNITNSTISGNSADNQGGGIYNYLGTVNITNSTISNNSVNSTGSGIINNNGVINAKNTIIAGNENIDVLYPDFSGDLSSGGYSIIGNTAGGSGFAPTDIPNVNPLLDPLANNGGTTPTHRLQPGSPAIDAGDATFASPYISPLPFDQRGEGYDRIVNNLIDIGSYEYLAG